MPDPIRQALEPPAPAEPDTDAVLALVAIIRKVDGSHSLGAAALAEAILSHPGVAFSVLPPAPAPADYVPGARNMVAADGEREELAALINQAALGWEPDACLLGNMTASQLARAAALLRQPAPAPTLETFSSQLAHNAYIAFVQICKGNSDDAGTYEKDEELVRVALSKLDQMERQPAPAPVPVFVVERPWERPGWCDAEGRCWWLVPNQSWPCLYLMKADSALAAPVATHCLPHWAIAIPQPPQGGEVEQ